MDGMQGMKEGKALSEPITDADSGLWKRKAVRRGFGVGLGGIPSSTCASGLKVRRFPAWVGDFGHVCSHLSPLTGLTFQDASLQPSAHTFPKAWHPPCSSAS